MAEVRPGDRAKTKKRTGGTDYPMETAAQIRSSVKMRHNGKSKSAARVLSLCRASVSRLLQAHKIDRGTAKALRAYIQAAAKRDRATGSKE